MKIFFTGSIRGGRTHQTNYENIVAELKKYGEVLSAHVADSTISEYGETEFTSNEILNREIEMLNAADFVVAEVTNPSLGVGYLIREATSKGKKVLALFEGENLYKLSAIVRGDKLVSSINYLTEEQISPILKEFFK